MVEAADGARITLAWHNFATLIGTAPDVTLSGGHALPLPAPADPPGATCSGSLGSAGHNVLVLCSLPLLQPATAFTASTASASVTRVFAVAFDADGDASAAQAQALLALSYDVEATVERRLAALMAPPVLANATLDRLSRKVYSVMRVNTLAPEGPLLQHWSTPDRAPHRAMWLWDR